MALQLRQRVIVCEVIAVTMELPVDLAPHVNLWIERGGQVVLSRWRVQLLEAIWTTGSISAAAERMGVQYRLAWERLEEVEDGLGVRLVERHIGGAGGGGASLTPNALDLIARFNAFATAAETAVGDEFQRHFQGL